MLQNFMKIDNESDATVVDSVDDLGKIIVNGTVVSNLIIMCEFRDDWKLVDRVKFKNVSFSRKEFSEITFRDCSFLDCLFIGCSFDDCEFKRCQFENCNFYKAKFDSCTIDAKAIKYDKIIFSNYSNVMISTYGALLKNYREMFLHEDAKVADVQRRKAERPQLKRQFKTKDVGLPRFYYLFTSNLMYECTSLYGYSPWRFLMFGVILFVLLCAPVFLGWGNFGFENHSKNLVQDGVVQSGFYVASIFTTLGFADLLPGLSFGKVFSIVVAFMGIIWTALFSAILVKRFLR